MYRGNCAFMVMRGKDERVEKVGRSTVPARLCRIFCISVALILEGGKTPIGGELQQFRIVKWRKAV